MLTLGELATFLERQAVRCREELTLETHIVLAEIAKDAEAMIGNYQPGWAELADATKEDRVRKGYTENDPLLRSGELRGSIESDAERTSYGVKGVVGSNSKIAAYQEMGTSKIPPRPFLGPALIQGQHKLEAGLGEFAALLLVPGIR